MSTKPTKIEMAVAVAKDVIKQLRHRTHPLNARGCGYIRSSYQFNNNKGDLQLYVDDIQKEGCAVCALGAAVLSKARLYNHVPLKKFLYKNEFSGNISLNVNSSDIYASLRSVFTKKQLEMMESAFERCDFVYNNRSSRIPSYIIDSIHFGKKYYDPKERLIAIMKNFIKNNDFVPPKVTAKALDEYRQNI